MVKNEINDFIAADTIINVESSSSHATTNWLSYRLNASQVPVIGIDPYPSIMEQMQNAVSSNEDPTGPNLSLQEIMIVGNCQDQVGYRTSQTQKPKKI